MPDTSEKPPQSGWAEGTGGRKGSQDLRKKYGLLFRLKREDRQAYITHTQAEAGGLQVQGQVGNLVRPCFKIKKEREDLGCSSVAECRLSMCEALGSVPSTTEGKIERGI